MQSRYTKIVSLLVILTALSFIAKSQDLHFSQYYFSHFTVNPSFTGKIKEDMRLFFIHRNQWKSINSSFSTSAFAYDMTIEGEKLGRDFIGVGIALSSDKLGDGIFEINEFVIASAYHKTLDFTNRNIVSVGLQVGLSQKKLDQSGFQFENQFDNFKYNPQLPSNEPLNSNSSLIMRINLGASWSYKIDNTKDLYTGISAFNINKPKDNFYDYSSYSDTTRLNPRYVFTGGFGYQYNDLISFHPSILLMRQSSAMDLNIGGAVGLHPLAISRNELIIYIGPWYRFTDAVTILSALEFKNYKIGFSYDFTLSKLNQVKQDVEINNKAVVGAFEITFTYVGFFKRSVPNDLTVPCKFF